MIIMMIDNAIFMTMKHRDNINQVMHTVHDVPGFVFVFEWLEKYTTIYTMHRYL